MKADSPSQAVADDIARTLSWARQRAHQQALLLEHGALGAQPGEAVQCQAIAAQLKLPIAMIDVLLLARRSAPQALASAGPVDAVVTHVQAAMAQTLGVSFSVQGRGYRLQLGPAAFERSVFGDDQEVAALDLLATSGQPLLSLRVAHECWWQPTLSPLEMLAVGRPGVWMTDLLGMQAVLQQAVDGSG